MCSIAGFASGKWNGVVYGDALQGINSTIFVRIAKLPMPSASV